MSAKPLGRGLDVFLKSGKPTALAPAPQAAPPPAPAGQAVLKIPVGQLVAGAFQPRKEFDAQDLEDLAASIKAHGILQPINARKNGDRYEIIAGERRWRAAQAAGLTEVPVIVREDGDLESLELALIENLQRSDLNCIEEAEGYALLLQKHQLTQEQVAQTVGKARATVANALRLLDLEPRVRSIVAQGHISPGHAKVLLSVKEAEMQYALAERIVKQGLSVRETEKIAATVASKKIDTKPGVNDKKKTELPKAVLDAHMKDLQNRLRQHLGTQVAIHPHGNKGRIEVEYYSLDDLNRITALLGLQES